MLFPFYCFGKFQDVEGQIAGPYFIVKGFGANHALVHWKWCWVHNAGIEQSPDWSIPASS